MRPGHKGYSRIRKIAAGLRQINEKRNPLYFAPYKIRKPLLPAYAYGYGKFFILYRPKERRKLYCFDIYEVANQNKDKDEALA